MKELSLPFDPADVPIVPVNAEKNFRSLRHPVWSEQKARLIQEYIKLFTFITKHGAYIDGFAAPQRRDMSEICSARLVLENEPKRVRDFWLCDIDPKRIGLLEEIASPHRSKQRRVNVVSGNFNETVEQVLASDRIPGASDAVTVGPGAQKYGRAWPKPVPGEPPPPPPVFEDDMRSIEQRADGRRAGREGG